MYKIYLGNELLYHSNMAEEFPLAEAKVALEVNKAGTFVFKIYENNPQYRSINKMKSIIRIYDDNYRMFRGRVLNAKRGMYNQLQVTCEGELAFLVDTKVRPYAFEGSVEEYFTFLIESHNSYANDEEKKFKVGRVTVTAPNDYIIRENRNYPTTLDEIQDKLINELGGGIWTREEEDGIYIDYLEDFEYTNTQEIRFGENLVDLEEVIKGQDIATVLIPLGCKLTDEEGNETEERLTISSINDGKDYIIDEDAVSTFGWIEKTVEWNDVTLAENLLTKGTEELQNYVNLARSIELTAVDLHNVDGGIQAFRYGRYTKVYSEPHGLDESMLTRKLELNILDASDGLLQLGDERTTFVDKQVQTDKNVANVKESVDKSFQINQEMTTEKVNQAVNEIYASMAEQSTAILQNSEEIIMEALKSYATDGSLEDFKSTVTTQLQLISDEMTLKFTETNNRITEENGELQSQIDTITKYFSFDIDGMTIGQEGNPNKVIIDNDDISILVNDVVVQQFKADGTALIPELQITRGLKMFDTLINLIDDGIVGASYAGGDE